MSVKVFISKIRQKTLCMGLSDSPDYLHRLFNDDETNYAPKRVLAFICCKNIYEVDLAPVSALTVMFTFSPSELIYPSLYSVPENWSIGIRDNICFFEFITNAL